MAKAQFLGDLLGAAMGGGAAPTYSISGTILDAGGVAVAGVTVTLGAASTTTVANGTFILSGRPAGTTGDLTPAKTGYTFAPANIAISAMGANLTGQDFVGSEVFDIYVAKTGSDSAPGDGTLAHPYLTINKAIAMAAASKKIGIFGGTYYEKDETISNANVTIKGIAGQTVIMSSSTLYPTWTKTDGQTNVYQCNTLGIYGVWNGTTYLPAVASIAAVDAQTNSSCWASNVCYVNIGGADPSATGGLNINVSAVFCLIAGAAGVTVDNIYFKWCMRGVKLSAAATIKNCILRYFNMFSGEAYGGVQASSDGGLVDTCTIEHMLNTTTGELNFGQGVVAGTGSSNLTVRNCTINYANNGVFTYAGTGHIVEYCTIDKLFLNGVFIDENSGCTVRYNTIHECNGGVLVRGTATATIHHNVISARADMTTGTGVRWGIIVEWGSTALVYHNVVANFNAITSTGGAAYLCKGTSNGTFYDNISYNNERGYAGMGGDTPTCVGDYNVSYGDGIKWDATWIPGKGAHDLETNPLFVSATVGAEDFHLQAGSSCIGAGVEVAGISLTSPVDIGRYG